MSMKLRIAALVLAVAFATAPALAVMRSGCEPCPMPDAGGPCTSLSAMSCCGEFAPVPAKSTLEAPSFQAIAAIGAAVWSTVVAAAPPAAHDLAAETSPLRLSVVRRL